MIGTVDLPTFEEISVLCTQGELKQCLNSFENILNKMNPDIKNKIATQIMDKRIIILKKLNEMDPQEKKNSRGGNNVSENGKKALLASMKKILPNQVFNFLHQHFILPYHLKSQKENMVIYFLILTLFVHQKKIDRSIVQKLREELNVKIRKYISNSQSKMELDKQRRDFHLKNVQEFEKIQSLDLDFFKERNFKETTKEIQKMYLKKKTEFQKAEYKIKTIIMEHPPLLDIFPDLKEQELAFKNSEPPETMMKSQE